MNQLDSAYVIQVKNNISNKTKRITLFSPINGVFTLTIFNTKISNSLLPSILISYNNNEIEKEKIFNFNFDVLENYSVDIYFNRENLYIFNSMLALLKAIFIYNHSLENLYKSFRNTVNFLRQENQEQKILSYIDFILNILDFFGIKISFTNYYKDDKEAIYYISPKTGNCVSKTKGKKYKDKLFTIPKEFLNFSMTKKSYGELLFILKFFLKKVLLEHEIYVKNFDDLFYKFL